MLERLQFCMAGVSKWVLRKKIKRKWSQNAKKVGEISSKITQKKVKGAFVQREWGNLVQPSFRELKC